MGIVTFSVIMNDKKVTISQFYDLFRNYERQKGHNFPILWPFQKLWMTKRSQFSDYERHCERQEFFGIIFSLFQWEILFSHIFAPLFCSFHYNRKWLHFEFHLISGIWRGRMCFFLWTTPYLDLIVTFLWMTPYLDLIVTFLWTIPYLDLIVTFLWKTPYLDLIVTFLWTTLYLDLIVTFLWMTLSRSNCDLFMNDTI